MRQRSDTTPIPGTVRGDSGFVARIEGTDLGHFVQMECMAGATRILQVESHGRIGYLYLEDGHVVHALAEQRVGEAAVFEMLRWTVGTIGTCHRPASSHRSIQTSWQGLLLRAAHAHDEAARAGKVVPFPDVSYSATPPSAAPPHRPKATEGPGMSAPDEERRSFPTAVRLDARGHVLTSRGEVEELASTAAYAKRLTALIGEDLGLEGFIALESRSVQSRLVVFIDGDDVVATAPEEGANLASLLTRLGLD